MPAATVVVLRDGPEGPETLMLRKNSKIAFGGMWVFPGGKVDDEDWDGAGEDVDAARNAAIREAAEEAHLRVEAHEMVV
ncbi:MAG TPA: NUDIX hydrolase, partial [Acidimicrobiaceae bacterium]|nr:NUDIX hydrolase [Acidimicrobiaceae bacterium]